MYVHVCVVDWSQVYGEIKGDVSAALLALIAREREEEAIDQALIAAGVSCLDNSAFRSTV